MLTIETSRKGANSVIEMAGRLEGDACQQFAEAIRDEIAAGARRLALDMGGVSAISEAGIFQLMRALKLARSQGGDLCVAQPSDAVRQALAVSALDQLLQVYDSTAEALAGN